MAKVKIEIVGTQIPLEVRPCHAMRDNPPFADYKACAASCPLLRQFVAFTLAREVNPDQIVDGVFIEDHMSKDNQKWGWQGGFYVKGRVVSSYLPINLRGTKQCGACHRDGTATPFPNGTIIYLCGKLL